MSAWSAVERGLLPVGLLIAWEATARTGALPVYLSSPTKIVQALLELAASGELTLHGLTSLMRAYVSFVLGAGLGVLFGLVAGMLRPVRDFFDPLVSFFYPIPKIAFLPVFLLLFGLGNGSQIAILSFAVFFPVFSAARSAVIGINPSYIWVAENMGASRSRILFRVLIPAALPALFSGLRIGLAHSFVLLFAAELIGARNGLGFVIYEGEEALRFDIMLSGIVAFAVMGFVSDTVLMAVRRRLLHGQSLGTEEQVR